MTRLLFAPTLALALLLFAITTPPAMAKQCGRLNRSMGKIHTFDCSKLEGSAAKQSRRHFRSGRETRREVVSPRLRDRVPAVGIQTDNDGRPIQADQNRILAAAGDRRARRAAHRGAAVRPARAGTVPSRSLAGVVAPLAAKAAEIASTCGSRVVSAVRHTVVAGTRTLSLHASGRAVDMVGNPACIAALLKGWPGGASTDYARVRHYHISYGGREHGLRFAHGGGRRNIRLARRTRIGR